MANFCGGIKLSNDLKVVSGVICMSTANTVDADKAVSVCGQLWDGSTFAVSGRYITASNAESGDIEPIRGNCGIGLDGRYFTLTDGVVGFTAPKDPDEPEEPRGDM